MRTGGGGEAWVSEVPAHRSRKFAGTRRRKGRANALPKRTCVAPTPLSPGLGAATVDARGLGVKPDVGVERRTHGFGEGVAGRGPEGPYADGGQGVAIALEACPDRMIRRR